jgi:hypothetical protein
MPLDQSRIASRYMPWLTKSHIRTNGVNVRWEKGIKCPCITDMGQPSIRCEICKGHGYAYPEPGKLMKGLLSSMQSQEQIAVGGLAKTGSMTFTPPMGVRMDDGDRITLLQFDRRESEVVERGDDSTDFLIQYEPIRIVAAYRIIEGANGQEMQKFATDSYKLTGGAIEWLNGKPQPDVGLKYTVQYDFRPKYQVYRMDDPKYRGIQSITIPQAVMLKYLAPIAPKAVA